MDTKRPYIIHFNYNARKNVNIGDEAHVISIQDTLRERAPELDIVDMPIDFLGYNQFPSYTPLYKSNVRTIQSVGRILRGHPADVLIRQINNANAVIIGGGGFYIDSLLPLDVRLIDKITVPIIILGVGYNHNFGSKQLDDNQLLSVTKIGNLATLQGVRDEGTMNFLSRLGIKSTVIGDPAIFLEATQVMSRKPRQKKVLNIGLNIAAHGWSEQGIYEDSLVKVYLDITKLIAAKSADDVYFYYFVHHPGENKIVKKLEQSGFKFKKVINQDARGTMNEYSNMDLTISMMLHSTILAFANSVPSICIGYDSKNAEFMKFSGQENQYVSVSEMNLELLMQKIYFTLENRENIKKSILSRKNHLRMEYDKFCSDTVKIITS